MEDTQHSFRKLSYIFLILNSCFSITLLAPIFLIFTHTSFSLDNVFTAFRHTMLNDPELIVLPFITFISVSVTFLFLYLRKFTVALVCSLFPEIFVGVLLLFSMGISLL